MSAPTESTQRPRRSGRGFPRIYAGRRRRWLHRLVLNGLAQGGAAFALTHLLQHAIVASRAGESATPSVVSMVAIGGLIWGLRIVEANDAERVGQDYVMRVRVRLFERVVSGPDDHARRRRFGVPMSRMIGDLNALRNWVSVGVARSLVASIMIGVLLLTMASIDVRAALVLCGLMAMVAAVMGAATPALKRRVREARRRRGRLANNLGEKVLARETVRQFAHVQRERRRIRRQSDRLAESLVERARVAQLLRAAPAALLPIGLAALVGLAAGSGAGLESVGPAVLVIGLLSTSLAEIARALDYRLSFQEGRARIGDLLSRSGPIETAEAGEAGAWPVAVEDVVVEGRLDRVRFEAQAGERIHVVGGAASGKSTLVDVLAARVAPDQGRVRLGPVSWSSEDRVDLHRTVQCVSPEAPLLRGTVATNLDYAGFDDEGDFAFLCDVRAACGLGDGAPGLPKGLETPVEERGSNLSASLRARIALARAALSRPRVLLVDDPAFAIDATAQRALRSVLDLVPATCIVVVPEGGAGLGCDRVWRLGEPAEALGGHGPPACGCGEHAGPRGDGDGPGGSG